LINPATAFEAITIAEVRNSINIRFHPQKHRDREISQHPTLDTNAHRNFTDENREISLWGDTSVSKMAFLYYIR
jgi:hypothetical protein